MRSVSSERRPRVLSGMQPTGVPHLGNYLGAMKHWIDEQDRYDTFVPIVNLHAITVPFSPDELRQRSFDIAAALLAAGLDPDKATLFLQSDVPEHTELAWLLGTQAGFGELSRMTQFKDRSQRGTSGADVGSGVLFYPVLMAADILLYDAELIPTGEDQRQHIELTRTLARRFNSMYGDTFIVPEPNIKPLGARIMSLVDPTSKMSKSDPDPMSRITFTDGDDLIRARIKEAFVETGEGIRATPQYPAVSNLLTIYSLFARVSISDLERRYRDASHQEFKEDLADVIVDYLSPIRSRITEYRADEAELLRVLDEGKVRSREVATATLQRTRSALGVDISSRSPLSQAS